MKSEEKLGVGGKLLAFPNVKNERRMPALSFLHHIMIKGLAPAIGQENGIEGVEIRKEEFSCALFVMTEDYRVPEGNDIYKYRIQKPAT